MAVPFRDRTDAGRQLAQQLAHYAASDAVVYALPRGGVPVAFAVAQALTAPMDLVMTRKIGHPRNPEYAVCAMSEDGAMLCDEHERGMLDEAWLKKAKQKEQEEAKRRRKTYLNDREHISAKGKTAILVDDGIATGLTIRTAVRAVRNESPKKLVVAVPVAPHETVAQLAGEADEVVVLEDAHRYRGAVGAYYRDFAQTSDQEVIELLERSSAAS